MFRLCKYLRHRYLAVYVFSESRRKSCNSRKFLSGAEAQQVFNDAQTMLNDIITNNSLQAVGEVSFYPANSVGDDIHLFKTTDGTKKHVATLYGLRQQVNIFFILYDWLNR